jgi:PAS domain S-box-containing protein
MSPEPTTEELNKKIRELEEQLTEARRDAAHEGEQASFLKDIIDNTNLPIYLKDSDYSYILVNQQYERLAGIEPDSIKGKNDFDIFPEPVATLFRSQDEEVKERGGLVEFTETIPLPDGIHTFITAKFPLKDTNGDIYALGGVCTDVTELRKAEEALRNSKRETENIIKSCPMGIHLYELEEGDRLVFKGANPAANNILGIDCMALIGKTIEEAFPALTDSELPEKYRLACHEGIPWHSELINYKDQQIEGAYKVDVFQTEPGMAAVMFEDITHKQFIDQELQKLQKLESIGILAGGIAHDFNNLLTVITGNISMAMSSGDLDANILTNLTNAEKASERARNLTQQLLTFSKGGSPVKQPAFLNQLVADSTTFSLSGSKVNSDLQLPADLPAALIDEGQISQVVQNLVKNAEQAMLDGGTVTIKGDCLDHNDNDGLPLKAGKYLRITVEDHGTGIAPDHLPKIFDPYFSTKTSGSGLGLAVAHSIIKNHGGLLTAESDTGRGAKFYFYLPVTDQQPLPDTPQQLTPKNRGGRILVMDDEETILSVVVDMLTHLGYQTETAKDGNEVLALYSETMETGEPYDAVMLDLTIPGGMGGEETIKHLLEMDPAVKAIVVSGYANAQIMSDFHSFGFSGVLAKPYNIESLKNAVAALLDS